MWWCVRYPLVLLALTVLCQATSTSDTWVSWREPRSRMSWTQPSRTWTQPSVTWTQSSMTWTQSSRTRSTPTSGNWLQPSHELAAQFCDGMMSGSGALRDCGDYYRRNKKGKNGLLKWCIDLFTEHGMEAKCHIISKFVDKCHDNGISIEDSLWREFHSCPRPGVLITTPNVWTAGRYGDVCVDFHYLYIPADVNVYLMLNDTEVISVSQTMDSSGCFKMPAPKDCVSIKYQLQVNITSIFYQYTSSKKTIYIRCYSPRGITFIQTDKKIYKAGQKVRFRVLRVSLPKLIPVVEDIERVYMETPGGTRILQKDNVTTNLGLAELDFQLDMHPPLGTWKIFVQNSAGKHSQQFKVDEFVLPKWSVTIEAPATVIQNRSATFKVCAKYTYGEAVQGTYTVNITSRHWYRTLGTVTFRGQIGNDVSGCVTLTVDASNLKGFYRWNYLVATASVTETASGISRNATTRRIYIGRIQLSFDYDSPWFFKRGSPYPVRVYISGISGSAAGIPIKIKIRANFNRTFATVYSTAANTDEEGAVLLLLPTDVIPENAEGIYVQATSIYNTHSFQYAYPGYSESKHFVTVVPPFKKIPCKGKYSFRIYHNTEPGTLLRYIIISKRSVIMNGTEYIPGTFHFSDKIMDNEKAADYFDMELTMSPLLSGEATMLVYYVTQSLEFIADFIKFNVDECFQNEVSFEFDKARGQPGEEAKYTLSSASDSLCGIGVIDRSLELLAGNSFLLKSQIFQILNRFRLFSTWFQFGINEYCRDKYGSNDQGSKRFHGWWTPYVDSSEALKRFGVITMSDLVLQTRPCVYEEEDYSYSRSVDTSRNSASYSAAASGSDRKSISEEETNEGEEVDIRKFFPETFLWKLVVIPKSGSITESVTLPDTITEWYGNAVCTNEDVGLGISDFASITTFQTFFVQLNLPYSIIRGETAHIPVLLFNYLNQDECFAVNIRIEDRVVFDIEGDKEYTVCSCGQRSLSVKFTITATKLGEIDITVVAKTVDNTKVCDVPVSPTSASDGVSKKVLVKPEGIEMLYTFGRYLCAPASVTADLPLPDNYVQGSERGQVSVVGDIMGPAFSNIDRLIRMPYGGGEQNIHATSLSAIALRYLDATGQVTSSIKKRAIRSMNSGYQRELRFKHPNGAYSIWGPRGYGGSTGSNWLTAYVIRVFALSEPYIFIDPKEQTSSMEFLVSGQDTDGCFPQVGQVIHKHIMGGLAKSDKPIALTAFILISLLEAGKSPTSEPVSAAIRCLDEQNIEDMNTYALALTAYAYALYGQDPGKSDQIMNELEKRAIIKENQKYWIETKQIPTGSCRWYCPPPSYDIEMTAYVLLAIVTSDGKNAIMDGIPIARWLSSQRNAYGGWSSTQDTFVGLLAISKYAMLVPPNTPTDVKITLPGITFRVDLSNRILVQKAPLDVPNNITITVSGNGCALVQVGVWYNIIPQLEGKAFFNITSSAVSAKQCTRQTLYVCVSYLPDDGPTNMALVQVKMVTGWDVDEDSLPQIAGEEDEESDTESNPGVITNIEKEEDTITFYFDKISSAPSCFEFQMQQEIKVRNAKAGHITAFDYYNTNKKTSVEYVLKCN